MIQVGNDLSMVRGDSDSITVTLDDTVNGGNFSAGDSVTFSVKSSLYTPAILLKTVTEFSNGAAIIIIDHLDTYQLAFGDHIYDIRVVFADGSYATIVEEAKFNLRGSVADG